jgi:hypothetical protein
MVKGAQKPARGRKKNLRAAGVAPRSAGHREAQVTARR